MRTFPKTLGHQHSREISSLLCLPFSMEKQKYALPHKSQTKKPNKLPFKVITFLFSINLNTVEKTLA